MNSEEVPALRGKQYADFHLDCKDWEKEADEGSTSVCKTFHYHFDND